MKVRLIYTPRSPWIAPTSLFFCWAFKVLSMIMVVFAQKMLFININLMSFVYTKHIVYSKWCIIFCPVLVMRHADNYFSSFFSNNYPSFSLEFVFIILIFFNKWYKLVLETWKDIFFMILCKFRCYKNKFWSPKI